MIVAKPKVKRQANKICIMTEKVKVLPKYQIRVLGWELNGRMSKDMNLIKVTNQINAVLVGMSVEFFATKR